jgi:hypothetical protein
VVKDLELFLNGIKREVLYTHAVQVILLFWVCAEQVAATPFGAALSFCETMKYAV